MKKLLLLLLIIFVISPLLIGGYLGLIPGISTVFGSDKPRDLGVEPAQIQQATGEHNTETTNEPGQSPLSAFLENDTSDGTIETSLTSEELTTLARNSSAKFNPLSEVQVRLNDDGTTEASGYIDLSGNLGELESTIASLPIPRSKVPFYISLTGKVIDNKVSTKVHKLELARVPIPVGIVESYLPSEVSLSNTGLLKNGNFSIETLEVRDEQLHIKGKLP